MAKMSDRWSYSEGKVDWRYNKRTNCYVELDYADCPPLPPPPPPAPNVTIAKANKKLIGVTKEVESMKLKSTYKGKVTDLLKSTYKGESD